MNKERMLKVADEIVAHADHFDMGVWMTSDWLHNKIERGLCVPVTEAVKHMDLDDCGTAACVAGWAAYLYAAELQEGDTFAEAGRRILGLTHGESEQLFESEGEAEDAAEDAVWVNFGPTRRTRATRQLHRRLVETPLGVRGSPPHAE
jgi:hypothetical protein